MLSKKLAIFSEFTDIAHVIQVATRKPESHQDSKVKGRQGSIPKVQRDTVRFSQTLNTQISPDMKECIPDLSTIVVDLILQYKHRRKIVHKNEPYSFPLRIAAFFSS